MKYFKFFRIFWSAFCMGIFGLRGPPQYNYGFPLWSHPSINHVIKFSGNFEPLPLLLNMAYTFLKVSK